MSVFDSVRMFFHYKLIVGPKSIHTKDTRYWNQINGYFVNNQHAREEYDYQPRRTSSAASKEVVDIDINIVKLPPARLDDLFAILKNVT